MFCYQCYIFVIVSKDSRTQVTKLFCYCKIRTSHSIRDQDEVPLGGNFNQGQGAGDQASHVVLNPPSIRSQATLAHSVGSQAVSVTLENLNNPTYW